MTAVLREALTPQQRYQRALDAVLRQVDTLEASSVRHLLSLLTEARQAILARLAELPDDAYLAFHQRQLQREIEQAIRRYGARYGSYFDEIGPKVWALGTVLVDQPLEAAGVSLMARLPSLEPRLLDVMANFRADLITGLEDAAISAVTREIHLGILGKPFAEVRQAIGEVLRVRPDPEGRLGSIAVQAERVWRTETNRLFSVATQSRQEQTQQRVAEVFPEVELTRQWLNAGDDRVRPSHRRASLLAQRPGVDEDFTLIDDDGQAWLARYPHDARLPVALSVNCRCRTVISSEVLAGILEAS